MISKKSALAAIRKGPKHWQSWRDAAKGTIDLSNIDLSGTRLLGYDFRNVHLPGANFTNTCVSYCSFYASNLDGAVFARSEAKASVFTDTSLESACFDGSVLIGASFAGASLNHASFKGADLCVANLSGATLEHTILDRSKLWDTAFCNLDLSLASLVELEYQGPCDVGTTTIERTAAALTSDSDGTSQAEFERFLRGCGVGEHWLELFRTLVGQPVQWYSAFISYDRVDRAFARQLYSQLQARGIRCWLDEAKLNPGDRLLDSINQAIRIHDRLLLCCSRSSLRNWWVKDEIAKAIERERKEGRDIIIPLDLDGFLLHEWDDGAASQVRSRVAAEFQGWDRDGVTFESQFSRVLAALQPAPLPLALHTRRKAKT